MISTATPSSGVPGSKLGLETGYSDLQGFIVFEARLELKFRKCLLAFPWLSVYISVHM